MAKVLGLDASSNTISVAVIDENNLLAEKTIYTVEYGLKYLVPTISQVLNSSALDLRSMDLITVTIGPGSWTGIRIGVETAKTISHVTKIPIVGIYTLDALAANIAQVNMPVYSVLDGRRGNVIWRRFDCSGNSPISKSENSLSNYRDFLTSISTPAIIIGEGCNALKRTEYWNSSAHFIGPKYSEIIYGRNICELGLLKYKSKGADAALDLIPYYLQRSDAETQWEQRNTKV